MSTIIELIYVSCLCLVWKTTKMVVKKNFLVISLLWNQKCHPYRRWYQSGRDIKTYHRPDSAQPPHSTPEIRQQYTVKPNGATFIFFRLVCFLLVCRFRHHGDQEIWVGGQSSKHYVGPIGQAKASNIRMILLLIKRIEISEKKHRCFLQKYSRNCWDR